MQDIRHFRVVALEKYTKSKHGIIIMSRKVLLPSQF